jgi:predicted esterase
VRHLRRRELAYPLILAVLCGTLAAVATAARAGGGKPATAVPKLVGQHRTLPGGRTYWLDGTGPDLVIGLPGMALGAVNVNDTFWLTGNPATTGWQRHAETNGYTLALGETRAGNWNVGGGWDGGTQDDMAYLLAIVDDVTTVRGARPAHVFAAGFSVGGAMAWDACALHPEIFQACGEASGWAPVPAVKPLDVWHVHGTADTTVPIGGGTGIHGFDFPPALNEAATAPRGSRVVLEPTSTGHGTPRWMAGRLWSFWTTGR